MFKKLGIKQKILFLIAVPLIVIIGVTTLSIMQLNNVANSMRKVLYDEGLAATSMVLNADRDMYQGLSALQEMAALDSTKRTVADLEADMLENFEQVLQRVDEAEAILNNNRSVWEQYRSSTTGQTVFESFEQIRADFGGWSDLAATMARNNRVSDIYSTTFLDDFNSARAGMNDITETLEIAMVEEVKGVSDLVKSSAAIVIIVVAFSFILVIILTLIITGGIVKIMRRASGMLDQLSAGHLSARVSVQDGARDEISQMINKMNGYADDLQNNFVANLQKISHGDLNVDIDSNDTEDEISPALQQTVASLRLLISEADRLTAAASAGELTARGDVDAFEGGYRGIVDGFNKTIDALVAPIQDAALVIQALSNGDLTIEMAGEYEGDNAILKNSLNGAIGSFNRLLSSIRQASEEVATGAREMSRSSQTLSQGATEQASSVEQVTASIEQLADQTKQNASNASAASQLSDQARHSADTGNTRMSNMLEAMTEINDSSKNISKIIKVIDDIAFQTNILALNAAVEAARAGQHGKGFAVVAEEVRNLAARSAEAAKETTVLIEKSIGHVNDGTEIAEKTAEALNEIVDKVTKTNELILKIAEASNEQASGIAQINTGLVQVSRVVQMNSATSEESAAASEELSSQAELLKEFVAQFNLKDAVEEAANTEAKDSKVVNHKESTKEKINEKSAENKRPEKKTEPVKNAEPKPEKKDYKSASKHHDPLSDTSFGDF